MVFVPLNLNVNLLYRVYVAVSPCVYNVSKIKQISVSYFRKIKVSISDLLFSKQVGILGNSSITLWYFENERSDGETFI